jgi:hypothetical protein
VTAQAATSPTAATRTATVPVVRIVGLVDRFHAPRSPGARTRDAVPGGYGTREQCLPFGAAAACGLAIPSPVSWGVCARSELPPLARAFRSPIRGDAADDRWCYVIDDDRLGFRGNQYELAAVVRDRIGSAPVPGISFFDRADQQQLLKVHLPYSWRTPEGLGLLILDPLNRPSASGLRVVAGLVETGWYANPINLVVELPPPPVAVHVRAGEQLAQAVLLPLAVSEPRVEAVTELDAALPQLDEIRSWRSAHARDRSAYKRLARVAARAANEG